MYSRHVLAALTVAMATVFVQSAIAQSSEPAAAPVTREQRKADTAAANKAGKLTPAGEAVAPQAGIPTAKSTTTRAQRKAQTKADAKAGKMTPAGEGGDALAKDAAKKSTMTKAERKAQTQADIKAGNMTPAGEGKP